MLSVVASWIYILITTYIIGFVLLEYITGISCLYTSKGGRKNVYRIKRKESYLIAGILFSTIYAEFFSLFGGVGIVANVILLVLCVLLGVAYRYEILESVASGFSIFAKESLWLYVLLFLVMAYGTSHGLMHYDSDLYHAQAIRWIEEYGVVKGLGNLHVRLGYNSASFALSALYSFPFLGKSMHTMAGYFALLLAWQCVDIKMITRRRHLLLSDFVRVIAVYYLFTIFDEIVAPASDYYMTTMVLYIVIAWLDLYCDHERAFLPHALLSIVAVYVTTIKLSAAPLILLAAYPIHRIFKRRGKEGFLATGVCTLFCLIIAIPYFIRNVILTGYLVYPFTAVNIFNPDWKVPLGKALYDAHEITAYGKGYTDALMYNAPITKWLPDWFLQLSMFNKGMLLLDCVSLLVFIGCIIYFIVVEGIRQGEKKGKLKPANNVFHLSHRKAVSLSDFIFIEAVSYVALLYWLFTSPLVRYGCVYLWLPAVILIGRFAILLYNRANFAATEVFYKSLAGVLIVFIALKCAVLVKEDIPRFNMSYLLTQQDYGTYECIDEDIQGTVFYRPAEGDRTGYEPFPAAPTLDGFGLRGSGLKDGFLPASSEETHEE